MPKLQDRIQADNYRDHKSYWSTCNLCDLCHGRKHVVLARGKVPAPVLFIGEAPGNSEDVLGRPFVGPAGHLLDQIIEQALDGQYDYALTNLVACIPKDETGNKTEEPSADSIKACAPRLQEFVRLCKPQLIVCVGTLASKWVEKLLDAQPGTKATQFKFVHMTHPAAILRAETQQNILIKRAIVVLENAAAGLR